MIRNILTLSLLFLSLSLISSVAPEKWPSLFLITTAFAEEEKKDPEVPELDEKGYFSNPHYDLEERHFNESERNFNEPDNHDYYERFDEKDYQEYH